MDNQRLRMRGQEISVEVDGKQARCLSYRSDGKNLEIITGFTCQKDIEDLSDRHVLVVAKPRDPKEPRITLFEAHPGERSWNPPMIEATELGAYVTVIHSIGTLPRPTITGLYTQLRGIYRLFNTLVETIKEITPSLPSDDLQIAAS